MLTLIIGFTLIFLAGLFEACMDSLQFHFETSVFSKLKYQYFWNPEISWKNKYRDHDPTKGEDFPGSTTLFVAVTDGWHLSKGLRTLSIFMGLLLISIDQQTDFLVLYFILSRILFGISFTLFFNRILVNK
jgi:hypothetical protein